MPFVGSTPHSPSSAFSSVDLPAPVLPTSTVVECGSTHFCARAASSAVRAALSGPVAQLGSAASWRWNLSATHLRVPTADASACSCASTSLAARARRGSRAASKAPASPRGLAAAPPPLPDAGPLPFSAAVARGGAPVSAGLLRGGGAIDAPPAGGAGAGATDAPPAAVCSAPAAAGCAAGGEGPLCSAAPPRSASSRACSLRRVPNLATPSTLSARRGTARVSTCSRAQGAAAAQTAGARPARATARRQPRMAPLPAHRAAPRT